MRDQYSKQLRQTQDELMRMGSRVEHAIALSVSALANWDSLLAEQVIHGDDEIDRLRAEIEGAVFHLLATQQPIIATDLRLLNATPAIASELERMGDYAKGIARRVQRCLRTPVLLMPPAGLHRLAIMALGMVHTSLNALVHMDPEIARSLAREDERVDELEELVVEEIMQLAGEDIQRLPSVVALLDIAHRLERLADRATNIAERVIFVATSHIESLNT